MDRKKTAAVWRYFTEDVAKRTVRCRLCDGVFKHHSNTTNMLKHIKAKHKDEVELGLLGIGTYGDSNSHLSPSKSKVRKLEEATQKLATNTEEKNLLDQFIAMVTVDFPDSPPDHQITTSEFNNSIIPNKNKKSPIWKFFDAETGSKEAKCLLCSGVFRHHGNTTNLMKHLRAKHIAEALSINIGPKSVKVKQEPTARRASTSDYAVSSFLTTSASLTKQGRGDQVARDINTTKSKLLDQKVMAMIVMDLQPLESMDSKYFADMMKVADPRYNLPSKKTIASELLPKLYKETVDQILHRLEDIKHIAITTELWSPRHQESYLGVTAHFICPVKWTMQSFMLSTTTFYGTPSGKHISSELERTLAEWDITEKVRVMITDNETNTLLSNEQLPWAYIPCLAHLIHIVVSDALSSDAETTILIEKVCGIVRYFKGDEDSKKKLSEAQASLDLPQNKLVLCVPSRWNSIYSMLERALEQMDAINAVLEDYKKDEMCLTSQDGDNLKMIIAALKPFEIATKTMSSENSMTIGTAMPLVKGLLKMMSSVSGHREPLATALKEGLVDSFGKIEDIDWIVAATVLDPRFKKFPYSEKNVIDKATEIITAELTSPQTVADTESPSISKTNVDPDSLWVYLDFDASANSAPVQRQETTPAPVRELQRYLEAPPVSREDNPLQYWRQHQELFPNLCQVAMKYLTVPITAIPCERLFTKLGETLMERRSKVKSKNINMMLFLNSNLPSLSS